MALELDSFSGQQRLLGDNTAENVTLSAGQLAGLSLGVWLLGGDDTVIGASDAEFIVGNQDRDLLTGLGGEDSLFGGRDDDFVQGGEGNDLVRGDIGDDFVAGDEGNDVLRGGRGNDKLLGSSGNDILYGDIGTDNLTGGEGNDVFVIPNKIGEATVTEADTIQDFKKGEDLIALTEGLQLENLKILPEPQNPNNILIQKDTGEQLAILKGVNSPLERSDFLVSDVAEVEVVDVNLRSPSLTLTPTQNLGDSFGNAIAASGNKLLVGSFDFTTPVNGGIAYLFDSSAGTLLKTFQKPTGFSPNQIDPFGRAVAIANNKVLIGSPFNNSPTGDNLGAAFLFDADTGALLQTFRSPNPPPDRTFGNAVAFVGNNVLIGASGDYSVDNPREDPGVAYLFDGNTGQLLQTFHNPNPQIVGFGKTVAALGNNVAIGASGSQSLRLGNTGAAYSFDSLTGQLLQTFREPEPSLQGFGSTLLATGNDILIGAPLGDVVYRFNASTGALIQRFSNPTPPRVGFGQGFGAALAIADNDILIGAPAYERAGAVFRFNGTTGNLVDTYLNPANSSGVDNFLFSSFGRSLAAVGDKVAIGASGSRNINGAVFLY